MSSEICLFKVADPEAFLRALADVVRENGGEMQSEPDNKLGDLYYHAPGTRVQAFRGESPLYPFCRAIAVKLDVFWGTLLLQEHAIWEFNLYKGAENLDLFSVNPLYWDDEDTDALEKRKGKPALIASAFEVPLERIERYLVHWGDNTTGKAYPSDAAEYGDYQQGFDFLKALGGSDEIPDTGYRITMRANWWTKR